MRSVYNIGTKIINFLKMSTILKYLNKCPWSPSGINVIKF